MNFGFRIQSRYKTDKRLTLNFLSLRSEIKSWKESSEASEEIDQAKIRKKNSYQAKYFKKN
jgi:hypothetical protein